MDWAAVTAAIMTGVAAVAGVIGTGWQASRARQAEAANQRISIQAEREHAELADKRRIYAHCLAAVNAAIKACIDAGEYQSRTPSARALEDRYNAKLAMTDAISEVQLIGPASVVVHAGNAQAVVSTYQPPAGNMSVVEAYRALHAAMRADLGQQPGGPVSPDSIPGQPGGPGPGPA